MNGYIEFLEKLNDDQLKLLHKYEYLRHEYGMMNPNNELSIQEMEHFGYSYSLQERMLPIGKEMAERLFEEGCEINLLYSHGDRKVATSQKEIYDHYKTNSVLGITEHELESEYKKSERFFIGEQYI